MIFAYDEGTEGSDRGGSDQAAGLTLPGYQDALIAAVAAANPNTVVVLNTGDPVLMPWAGEVKAILEMWYPGQEGGQATADVLLGKANPGGRLPVDVPGRRHRTSRRTTRTAPTPRRPATARSIPASSGRSPFAARGDHELPHHHRHEVNGIFQGYRWYDKHGVAPLFPFGHGLSYTQFAYSGCARRPRAGGGFDVTFDVSNTGCRTRHRRCRRSTSARRGAARGRPAGGAPAGPVRGRVARTAPLGAADAARRTARTVLVVERPAAVGPRNGLSLRVRRILVARPPAADDDVRPRRVKGGVRRSGAVRAIS